MQAGTCKNDRLKEAAAHKEYAHSIKMLKNNRFIVLCSYSMVQPGIKKTCICVDNDITEGFIFFTNFYVVIIPRGYPFYKIFYSNCL